jgi:hypothetical protein
MQDFHPFLTSELPVERQVFGAFGNASATKAALAGQTRRNSASPSNNRNRASRA